jgi:hypothetical protein
MLLDNSIREIKIVNSITNEIYAQINNFSDTPITTLNDNIIVIISPVCEEKEV